VPDTLSTGDGLDPPVDFIEGKDGGASIAGSPRYRSSLHPVFLHRPAGRFGQLNPKTQIIEEFMSFALKEADWVLYSQGL
jgi:hypothetical protein